MIAVALVVTVKNEVEALPRLFESILAQTSPPQQVVITDGGSTDRTREVVGGYSHRLNLTVIDCPGANISQGRNAAIACAGADIIASTDAGVCLDSRWLEELVKPFDKGADVVSGFFVPDPQGIFETALAATTLPALKDIRPEKFLPSSRSVAFRKRAWREAGGYPEWLDYGEDLVFDLTLRSAGCRFAFAPTARVFFRPRGNLPQFARQYYLYARGDGKANLWLERHLVRYSTYLIGLPISFALFASVPWVSIGIWVLGFLFMFFTPYRRLFGLWQRQGPIQRIAALAWLPAIRVTGDVAKMIGYPVGVWWRVRNRGA